MTPTIYWYYIDVHWCNFVAVEKIIMRLGLPVSVNAVMEYDGQWNPTSGMYRMLTASDKAGTETLLGLQLAGYATYRITTDMDDVIEHAGLGCVNAIHAESQGDLCQHIQRTIADYLFIE